MIRTPLTLFLAVVMLATVAPRTTHAQWVVEDPLNLIENAATSLAQNWDMLKEGGLDAIAWEVSRAVIKSITKSTVNWINTGFDGSPGYVTDLNKSLLRVGDRVADGFFNELQSSNQIDSPFRDEILQAVRGNYYRSTGSGSYFNQNKFTLGEVSDNPDAFLRGDFEQGGWDAWLETWRNPQNTPFGAYHQAQNEVGNRINSAQGTRSTELDWGSGILSWRGECDSTAPSEESGGSDVSLSGAESQECATAEIQTPGSIIGPQVNNIIASQVEQLGLADEYNEVIGAVIAQLTTNILGGDGLRGISNSKSGGGSSYIDRAENDKSGSNAGATLTQTLRNQRGQVVTYETNWKKIQGAAQSAASCGANTEVQAVLDEAAAALTRASNSLAGIDALIAKLQTASQATGGNQLTSLQEAGVEYQRLMSTVLPTSSDFVRAKTESRTTGNGGTSLYQQMTEKAKACGRT